MTIEIRNWRFLAIEGVQEIFNIEPLTTCGNPWKPKRVHLFKRKANVKTYTNPRIILSPESIDLVGRKYYSFRGRAVYKQITENQEQYTEKGEVVLLFLPETGK